MSQKQTLIEFLKKRTTTFTVDEINAVINIVNTLKEPNLKEATEAQPSKKKK